jgi:predicted aspartyl protease
MTAHQFEYDTDYPGPALPVVELGVTGRAESRVLSALVDSGADATLIPVNILQAVDARKIDSRWARNISGVRYRVAMYAVDLGVGSFVFPDTEVIANHQTDEIVLGRDILNQLIVTLNGLASVVEITR